MKKYKVLISNTLLLSVIVFVISLICNSLSVTLTTIISVSVALIVCTAAMIALSKSNFKGYTDIPTWKHLRNLFIYVIATILSGLVGYLF